MEFMERIKKMIPDAETLLEINQEWKSIRVNTLKIDRDSLLKRLEGKFEIKEMPWYENGFFIKDEDNIAKTEEYYLGYYYIQEASSMLPPLVMDLQQKDFVFDLCAAPGSKTTQIAMMLENTGLIIANDIKLKRIRALTHNIQKSGATNCIVTNYDARLFYKTGLKAEKILLDVPCTASGKIIKKKDIPEKWSYGRVKSLAGLQKKLVESAYKCLERNGIIIYSTCSLEPEENEEVIDFAVEKLGMEVEKINLKNIKIRRGVKEWNDKKFEWWNKVIRIWPQDNKTEGFFICKLRKF